MPWSLHFGDDEVTCQALLIHVHFQKDSRIVQPVRLFIYWIAKLDKTKVNVKVKVKPIGQNWLKLSNYKLFSNCICIHVSQTAKNSEVCFWISISLSLIKPNAHLSSVHVFPIVDWCFFTPQTFPLLNQLKPLQVGKAQTGHRLLMEFF